MKTLIFFYQHDDDCAVKFAMQYLQSFRAMGYDTIAYETDKNVKDITKTVENNLHTSKGNLQNLLELSPFTEQQLSHLKFSSMLHFLTLTSKGREFVSAYQANHGILSAYLIALPNKIFFCKFLLHANRQHHFHLAGLEDNDINANSKAIEKSVIDSSSRDYIHVKNMEELRLSNKKTICFIGVDHFIGIKENLTKILGPGFHNYYQMHFLHTRKDRIDVPFCEEQEEYLLRWFWLTQKKNKTFPLCIHDISSELTFGKVFEEIKLHNSNHVYLNLGLLKKPKQTITAKQVIKKDIEENMVVKPSFSRHPNFTR